MYRRFLVGLVSPRLQASGGAQSSAHPSPLALTAATLYVPGDTFGSGCAVAVAESQFALNRAVSSTSLGRSYQREREGGWGTARDGSREPPKRAAPVTVKALQQSLPGLDDDGPLLSRYIECNGYLHDLTMDQIRRILEYTAILSTLPHLNIRVPNKLALLQKVPVVLQRVGLRDPEDISSLVDIVTQLAEGSTAREIGAQKYILDAVAPTLTRLIGSSDGSLSGRHVSLIAWAYGKKRLSPRSSDIWPAIARRLCRDMEHNEISTADLCRTLWGLAEIKYTGDGADAPSIEELLRGVIACLQRPVDTGAAVGVSEAGAVGCIGTKLDTLSLLDVATLMDACTSLDFSDPDFMSALASRAALVCMPLLSEATIAFARRSIAHKLAVPVEALADVSREDVLLGRIPAAIIRDLGDTRTLDPTLTTLLVEWWMEDNFLLPTAAKVHRTPHVSQEDAGGGTVYPMQDVEVAVGAPARSSTPAPARDPALEAAAATPGDIPSSVGARRADQAARRVGGEVEVGSDTPVAREAPGNATSQPPTAYSDNEFADVVSLVSLDGETPAASTITSPDRKGAPTPLPSQPHSHAPSSRGGAGGGGASREELFASDDVEEDDASRLTRGNTRALNVIAHSLAAHQAWNGPFFSVFKRLYLKYGRKLEPRDTLRLVQTNLALKYLSPIPHLQLGTFTTYVDASDSVGAAGTFRQATAACPSHSPLHDPRWRPFVLKMFRHQHYTRILPSGCGVASTGYAAFIDPMNRLLSAYVPAPKKRDQPIVAQIHVLLQDTLPEIIRRLERQLAAKTAAATAATAAASSSASRSGLSHLLLRSPRPVEPPVDVEVAPGSDATSLRLVRDALLEGFVANFLTSEGMLLDIAFPTLKGGIKLVFPSAFSPRMDKVTRTLLMEQYVCNELGWAVAVMPAFSLHEEDAPSAVDAFRMLMIMEVESLANSFLAANDSPPIVITDVVPQSEVAVEEVAASEPATHPSGHGDASAVGVGRVRSTEGVATSDLVDSHVASLPAVDAHSGAGVAEKWTSGKPANDESGAAVDPSSDSIASAKKPLLARARDKIKSFRRTSGML